MKSIIQKYFSGLTKNIILLAFTSLFAVISTEMLYPVLPIYLTQYLKASGSIVGIIEGIAQATQNIVQGVWGYISDKLQKRKPFIGIATTWQIVLAARFSDRLGTGIRSAPRDALIAASVDEKHRARHLGLKASVIILVLF